MKHYVELAVKHMQEELNSHPEGPFFQAWPPVQSPTKHLVEAANVLVRVASPVREVHLEMWAESLGGL